MTERQRGVAADGAEHGRFGDRMSIARDHGRQLLSERAVLGGIIKKGKFGGQKLNRARTLLPADEDQTDEAITASLHTCLLPLSRRDSFG